ncbi:MAG: hypothetical protein Q8K64_13290 [Sediminibacterium sp.]|nr:MAG: Helix-turn-helix domain [Chitinophagaceae bacterium]MDP1844386.1 hypothetical protein [Sediminibacterium sp.]
MPTKKNKTVSLDTMIDRHIGKKGTAKRDKFEYNLNLELLGISIRKARNAQ